MFLTGRIRAAFFFASGGAGKGKRQGRARRENGQTLPGQGIRIVNQIESVEVLLIDILIFGCCCSCLCPKMTFDSCYDFSRKVSFAQKVLEKGGPKVFGKRSMNQFVSV